MKYFLVDSSFRNRIKYPNPTEFELIGGNTFDTSLSTVQDPIINAIPFYTSNIISATSTTSIITLPTTASSTFNFYINNFLMINNQYRQIVSYDGSTKSATVISPFTVSILGNPTFYISKELPLYVDTAQAGSTNSSVVLTSSASSNRMDYNNSYIYIPSLNIYSPILYYNPTTYTATLSGPLSSNPTGLLINIMRLTRDNFKPFICNTNSSAEEKCYEIKLINLTLPNPTSSVSPLMSSEGGSITMKPYVLVEFSMPFKTTNTIITNNSNSTNALFCVPINYYNLNTTPFIQISNINITQTIKLNLREPKIRFRITLPNGSTLLYQPDNLSPYEPNTTLQVSAVFELNEI